MSLLNKTEILKRDLWTTVAIDEDLFRIFCIDESDLRILSCNSDGCINLEEWNHREDGGVLLALKGTEGLRKFSSFICERLK